MQIREDFWFREACAGHLLKICWSNPFEEKKEEHTNTNCDPASSQIENTKDRHVFVASYLNIMDYVSGVGVVTN